MARKDSVAYTVGFAAVVCVVCALLVSVAAVVLQPTQDANARLYKQKNVLLAAGLVAPGASLSAADQQRLYTQRIEPRLVDLAAGSLVPADKQDATAYDQRRARNDPAQSRAAPANRAGIARVAHLGEVYFVKPASGQGPVEQVVLAIEGLGMWGTVYGFIALAPDGNTVQGLAFYEQKETPGLGGEIANPKWLALWRGRRAYDAQWQPQLTVVKGPAGPAERDPHRIDGLSGATITSNAVTRLVQFWLADDAYGRWLKAWRGGKGA
jgi:Na+-transporting NADH:ubiquinone oxidoreductase subunit C